MEIQKKPQGSVNPELNVVRLMLYKWVPTFFPVPTGATTTLITFENAIGK